MSVNKKQNSFKTSNELMLASEHLGYEINMFYGTIQLLIENGNKQTILSNILLESMTLRIRILLHFFYPEKAQKDDILAEHFFDIPYDWIKVRGDMPNVLKEVKLRVGKEIAHLTYERQNITYEEKKWNFKELLVAIDKLTNIFLEHVPKDKLDSNYFNWDKL